MFTMTDRSTMTEEEGLDVTDRTNRRRVTDIPQPLDYATKELVSEFIENQQPTAPPLKSLIRKLLKIGQS